MESRRPANPDIPSRPSSLNIAVRFGKKAITELLLSNGADANHRFGLYRHSDTALQVAASGGHQDIVSLLLEKGAEVNAQRGWHRNALQAAASEGHREIAQLVLEKDATRV